MLLCELRDSVSYSPSRVLAAMRRVAMGGGSGRVVAWFLTPSRSYIKSFVARLGVFQVDVHPSDRVSPGDRLPYSVWLLTDAVSCPYYDVVMRRYAFTGLTTRLGDVAGVLHVTCADATAVAQVLMAALHVEYCSSKPFDGASLPPGVSVPLLQKSLLMPPSTGTSYGVRGASGSYFAPRESDAVSTESVDVDLRELAPDAPLCIRRELTSILEGVVPLTQANRLRVTAIWQAAGFTPDSLTRTVTVGSNPGRPETVRELQNAFSSKKRFTITCGTMHTHRLCAYATAREVRDIEESGSASMDCAQSYGAVTPGRYIKWSPSLALQHIASSRGSGE